MDDRDRLRTLTEKLQRLDGIDEELFRRLAAELDRKRPPAGYDDHGKVKIAMFDARSYDIESFDGCNGGSHAFHYIPASLTLETAPAAHGCKGVCIFVNDRCDAAVIDALAEMGIQLIALRCAGFNNVDLTACEKNGISVVRVPAYSPHAVAEHTIALIMMLNRHLHQAYVRNRIGYFVLDGLTGFDMRGKTVGVIGTGKIGQCTIDILLGFGCRVLAFDKFPSDVLLGRENVTYTDLDDLLARSDIITLHVPLFSETYHLIDESAIGKMKNSVMLINTSRGGLVDTKALVDGLKSGKIGAAGLDVYEEEGGIFFHDVSAKVLTDDVLARLLTFNNVVVTSHQAFLTHEALANIAETTIANIAEFEQGKRGDELTNIVRQT